MATTKGPPPDDGSVSISARRVIPLALLLGAALIGGATWLILSEHNKIRSEANWAENRFGLRSPVPGKLAAGYVDRDDDLIADPPADGFISPETLKFSYIAAGAQDGDEDAWQSFLDRLSSATGLPVQYQNYESLADQMDAFEHGELHVTALNTGNVPRAVNECGFVPLCVKADQHGDWRITMKVIVPSDSPVRSVGDLRNRSITFVNPSSFSGFKFAVVVLQNEFGLRLGRDYDYRFSTSHDESIRMVAAGEQESATVASDLLQAAYDRGRVQPDQIREIYESTPFPAAAFGMTHKLAPELAEKVKAFLIECDLTGTPIASEGGAGGTLAVTNYREQWQAVRDVDAAIAAEDAAPIKSPAVKSEPVDEGPQANGLREIFINMVSRGLTRTNIGNQPGFRTISAVGMRIPAGGNTGDGHRHSL